MALPRDLLLQLPPPAAAVLVRGTRSGWARYRADTALWGAVAVRLDADPPAVLFGLCKGLDKVAPRPIQDGVEAWRYREHDMAWIAIWPKDGVLTAWHTSDPMPAEPWEDMRDTHVSISRNGRHMVYWGSDMPRLRAGGARHLGMGDTVRQVVVFDDGRIALDWHAGLSCETRDGDSRVVGSREAGQLCVAADMLLWDDMSQPVVVYLLQQDAADPHRITRNDAQPDNYCIASHGQRAAVAWDDRVIVVYDTHTCEPMHQMHSTYFSMLPLALSNSGIIAQDGGNLCCATIHRPGRAPMHVAIDSYGLDFDGDYLLIMDGNDVLRRLDCR